MSIDWWHWLVLGLVLIALELAVSGGLHIIFFGSAALIVGILSLLGIAGPIWMQVLLFTIFSGLSLSLFRRPLQRMLAGDGGEVDSLVGETALTLDDIPPGEFGRAELRGSVWSARNASGGALRKGQRCTVTAVDRLTLILQPEGARP
jgi:membrane protein implicated in regulation of membrane protease activity